MSDATPPVPSVPPAPEPATPAAAPTSGTPAPRYGEFAPVEPASAASAPEVPAAPAVDPSLQAAPGQPVTYAAPVPPAAPGYPQQGGYPQQAYPQPVYGQPGFGTTPAPKRRTWDVVLTIILLVIGLGGMLLGVLYGVIFSDPALISDAFQQQGLGDFDGEVGSGPIVLIASHVILYLVAAGVSVLLLVKKKIAFWVPLVAGVIAAVIFWAVLVMIMMSDPDFMNVYGA